MAYAAVVIGVVALATGLVAGARERAAASSRLIWVAGLVVAAALVFAAPLRRPVAVAPVVAVRPDAMVAEGGAPPPAAAGLLARARQAAARADRAIAGGLRWLDARPRPVHVGLAALWGGSTLVVLAGFGWAVATLARRRRRWAAVEVDGVPVRLTDGVGPLVVGVANSEIALPPWVVALPAGARALVLAHEVEHQRGRDPLLLAVGGAAVALLAWHPAVWWLFRRLSAAIELECDARVLGRGVAARDYGMLLLDIASRARPRSLFTPWPTLGVTSHLERRVLAMTRTGSRRGAGRQVTVAVVVAGALLAVACERTLPTSAEVEAMDGAAAAKAVPLMADGGVVRYVIGDSVVSASQFRAVPAEEIASVEVRRTGAASEVRIQRRNTTRSSAPRTTVEREAPTVAVRMDSAAGTNFVRVRGRPGDTTTIRIGSTTGSDPVSDMVRWRFDGILLIDGVEQPASAMQALRSDAIERVEVVKGSAAALRFPNDPRASQGIIQITTKAGAAKR
jgi:hypothetical protein